MGDWRLLSDICSRYLTGNDWKKLSDLYSPYAMYMNNLKEI